MKPPSDRKLVEETLQGKGESFSRLIDRYKYAIYGICLSLVGSFHLAEDMAQESFLKAFLNLNRLDDPDRFGNWLRTIAANECRQYLRRNRPRFVPFTQAQEMEGSVARHLLPPDQQRDLQEQEDRRQRLETAALCALNQLSEKNREVLTLYYLGGYTAEEVARFLNTSMHAVKMRLHRARKQLREEAFTMVQASLAEKKLGPDFEDAVKPVSATIFFSDVARFANIAENLPAKNLVSLLNAYLSDMTEILLHYGGTLDKYEGDAIIAFWGAPDPCPDHAARACLAALDMQEKLAQWRREDKPDLHVRFGLNTGQVMVGNIGSRQFKDYSVVGDHVMLGAWLEMVNKPYGTPILVSASTYEAARDVVEGREVDTVRIPGLKMPVTIYEILARKGELTGGRTRLIARFEEGRKHYADRNYQRAIEYFEKALETDPEDGPSQVLLERCRTFLSQPPAWLNGDWDGGFEWTHYNRLKPVQHDLDRLRVQTQKLVAPPPTSAELGPDLPERLHTAIAPGVIQKLISNPNLLQLDGSSVDLTILFSDIEGFASLFEQLTAAEALSQLSEYHSEMIEIILNYDGTLDKYEGDAAIAFWGAPVPCPDHATRACLTALDMERRLEGLCATWLSRGKPALKVRYGINTGPAVVGNMGSRQHMDYTVMGEHINLGALLEGANKAYGTRILISEYTFEVAKEEVEVREVDTIRVRSYSKPVTAYEVLARKGEINNARARLIDCFAKGLASYRAKNWKQAFGFFSDAVDLDPEDGPSRTFKTRCETFIHNPPGWLTPDWDGVYNL